MSIKKTFVCAAIAASAFAAQASNLVGNGSFEQVSATNAQASGTWSISPNIIGWTGGSFGIEVRDNVAGVAQDGSNFVELDTTKNSFMSQDITGNGWYKLSFWYSPRAGVKAGSNGIGFVFGDLSEKLMASTAGGPVGTGNQWQNYTGLVELNGTETLQFFAFGKSDGYGGSLDNVSVTAVPEPETYAMMFAGLALMGTIARRRKNKAA